jgi:hypothetical protein
MSIGDAVDIVEQLTMTQHKTWRPDHFSINDKYIFWQYGTISKGHGSAVAIDSIVFGSVTSTTRSVGERLYFNSIHDIQLQSWKRKFSQWYVVSAFDNDNNVVQHLFRTQSIEDAKRFTDAIHALVLYHENS